MQCTVSFLACLWGAADREGVGSVRTLLPTLGSHPVSHSLLWVEVSMLAEVTLPPMKLGFVHNILNSTCKVICHR